MGEPTVVNNVETFANLPEIINRGAEWYAAIGAPNYPGTKVLTLTGDVVNRTAIEVPTNTTVRSFMISAAVSETGRSLRPFRSAGLLAVSYRNCGHPSILIR